MENVLPFAFLLLAVLACPLMMVGMGVVAWMWARGHGEKKEMSMGCMSGSCKHEEHAAPADADALRGEVSRLQREVESLRNDRQITAQGRHDS